MKTKKGPITIKDIARKLDISTSTVSRAMRNLPDVNPKTRKAVQELARELDYEPNSIALSLVTRRTNTVGVIIPGFIIHFYSSAISGIQRHLSEAGYNVIICQSGEDTQTEISNVQALLGSRVDGIIMSLARDTRSYEHIQSILKKGTPLVFFNRGTHEIDASHVVVDDFSGARKAVQHLVDEGCRRIAHIAGPSNLSISRNRLEGYKQALKDNAFTYEQDLVQECDFTMESGIECLKKLLELPEHPDAIFCVCDSAAFGAIKFLKEKGIRIPEEIAIVGYTNEPLAELIEPSLTTIAQPTYEIGTRAAQLFLNQVNLAPEERKSEITTLKTSLVIRNSSRKSGF